MNILVSACLLGTPCRYDGTGKLEPALERLRAQGHTLVPGSGVAAQLLEEQGIAVYGESRLDELISQLSAER